jgi:hypothetical protein
MQIEQQQPRRTHLSTKSESEEIGSTNRATKKRVPNEIRYLVPKKAEEILRNFNRPMFGVEIYDNLPDSLKSKVRRDKMYRILDRAGSVCLNSFSDLISGTSAEFRLPQSAVAS